MRWTWVITLAACAPSPPAAPPLTTVDVAPPATAAELVAASPAPPVEPVIAVRGESIMLDDAAVGSTPALEAAGRLTKVDALFERLRERRESWKAANPHRTEPFRGAVSIVVEPQVAASALMSVFQTAAYAGFPTSWVGVGERFVPLAAQIPSPPCGGEGEPSCPPGREGYVLRVEVGAGWRLRLAKEDGPVDAEGADLPGFRAALKRFLDAETIHAIVLHLPPQAAFEAISPYLAAVTEANERAELDPTTLSVRPFDSAPTVYVRRREGQSSVSGRLAPEAIQRIVRQSFGEFRRCYENVLRVDPDARGKVQANFTIADDGAVSQVSVVVVDGNLGGAIGPCLENHFAALTFPPPEGGVVTVTYPIVFTPGD